MFIYSNLSHAAASHLFIDLRTGSFASIIPHFLHVS